MTTKVGDVFGHKTSVLKYERDEFFPTTDAVGVEIELENVNLDIRKHVPGFTTYWKQVPEDSIRNNGAEFAMTSELWGRDLSDAFDLLDKFIKKSNEHGYVEATERCSIHVHVDVRSLSVEQLRNFILISTAVEPMLFKVSGNRRGSVYCLPYYDSYMGDKLLNDVASLNDKSLRGLSTEKYASINLSAISKQGSIEFRHHEGTTDVNRIRRWVKCLLNIKEYATGLDDVIHDLPGFVSQTGFIEFIQNVFKDQVELFTYQGFHIDLLEGVRATQEGLFLDKIKRAGNSLKKKGSGTLMRNFLINNEDKFIIKGDNV